jgi:hypothetical protein
MTTAAAVPVEHVLAPPRRTRRARIGVLAAMLGVPLVLGWLSEHRGVHSITTWLCSYSPQRFAAGAFWTLPLSGVIAAQPRSLGPGTIAPFVVLVPYVLGFGWFRPLLAFVTGHLGATALAAALLGAGAMLGSNAAADLLRTPDVGISAGLAGAGGGLAVALWRTRWRPVVVLLLAALLWLFTRRILVENPARLLADLEHLTALGIGATCEVLLGRPTRVRA